MADIFIIDDNLALQKLLIRQLQSSGHRAKGASTLSEGVQQVTSGKYDIILLDVELPDGNGLEHIPQFTEMVSAPEVIIITGNGEQDGAETAISSGAWAYVEKLHVVRDIMLHVTRALQYREEKSRIKQVPVVLKRDDIIGKSPLLRQCLEQVAQAALSDASVLITGETGTGKVLLARALHEHSQRAAHNFITVDCAALPENLIESTLFGHVKGAFTGAESTRQGLIRRADGGTLFLDEVGELPLTIQKKFLRVLQEHTYRPVGSASEERSDFRVVAATNIDIDHCVDQGTFRSDLLYRLKGLSLSPPPLRKRKDDIKVLTSHFLARICDRLSRQWKGVTPEFIEHLVAYDWPGNIRELQQTLEQVVACTGETPTLFAKHLPSHFRIRQAQAALQPPPATPLSEIPSNQDFTPLSWQKCKRDCEQRYISGLMRYAREDITSACQISGLSRTRLYQLRLKYNLLPST